MVRPFEGVVLNHVARETEDVQATGKFYQEIFGFETIETPKEFGDSVVWLKIPPSSSLHIIRRRSDSRLPESPFTATDDAKHDESLLQYGHHLSFRVSDYNAAIALLKEKKIRYYEKTRQEGRIKQAFFFDPDRNEVSMKSISVTSPCDNSVTIERKRILPPETRCPSIKR